MNPSCSTCRNWLQGHALSGDEMSLLEKHSPDHGVCKEGPISVAKNKHDFCVGRWRLRESEAGGRDVRERSAA